MIVTTGGRGFERLVGIDVLAGVDVDVALRHADDVVAELLDQQLGGVLVDRLVDGDHHVHVEQRLHQVGALLGHAVGEFLHRDRSGTTTSRTCFSRGCDMPAKCARRSFSRARLSAASERARAPSSSLSARLTVSLPPRRRSSPPPRPAGGALALLLALLLGPLGLGTRDRRELARRGRRRRAVRGFAGSVAGSSSAVSTGAGTTSSASAARVSAASPSARRFSPARRFSSSSAWDGILPRGGAIPRPGRRRSSSASRWRTSDALLRRSLDGGALRGGGGGRRCGDRGRGRRRRRERGFARLAIMRRRLTSTTTLLVRPWLKVCLTSPRRSSA
jgi:hypothetical protein